MWSVLEAVYDGPIDLRSYVPQPVILEALPDLSTGEAVIQPVEVVQGDEVVDIHGNLMTLVPGIEIYPSGCRDSSCAVSFNGQGPVSMDQMAVTFRFRPGVTWSDGHPLTAGDSVYSFQLAAAPDTPMVKFAVERTASYRALDDTTLQWIGMPGYIDASYQDNVWLPLPEHAWSHLSPADLLQAVESAEKPLGWGPYIIEDWVRGDHITMRKNPAYFRQAEGLPRFDHLIFRFLTDQGEANLEALRVNECDVLDQTTLLDEHIPALQALVDQGQVQALFAAGPEWEHLDFGIRPAAYDDGYNPAVGDRPDLFADPRTRRAFALCADREKIINRFLGGQSQVPASYLPPQHPLAFAGAATYAYDPGAGAQLLEEAGWKDSDQNPATPRTASGVQNVPDGTPLAVRYWTTQAELRQQTLEILSQSLAGCGIQVTSHAYNPGELFAAGPDGPLFGRNFDLVQFTWESSLQPLCYLYMEERIPDVENNWVGANVTGYSHPEFEAACTRALAAPPNDPAYLENHHRAQEIFALDLPVIPLYQHVKVAAARPDLCGLALDPTTRSSLWNLEALDYGEGCRQPAP
jgi:peptide/nickel transport system substrate-binding protein